MSTEKTGTHFIVIAGFSSDHLEAIKLKKSLETIGLSADALSFYGEGYIDDFTDLNISECLTNASSIIDRRAEQYEAVYGIGICLGGALFLEHAKHAGNLKGIASIGTPFRLNNKFWIELGLKLLPFFYFIWRRAQKIKWLRLSPLGATKMVVEYLETDLPKDLGLVKTPTLLLHSRKDAISDYRALPEYLDLIGSEKKKITYFSNGNHIIDHDPDLVIKYVLDFFEISRV